jgi:hypothetical protein
MDYNFYRTEGRMKRATIVLVLIALVTLGLCAETSDLYPVRIDVVKVYSHADGLQVVYRKGSISLASAYLPIRWFVSGGKAELVRANDPSYPYMTVFYKQGKFDHLRLYVLLDQADDTWGILPPAEGKGKFDSDELNLNF